DASFGGRSLKFQRAYSSYVMENVLFMISFPAEFHAQTAVEAAIRLHPFVRERWNEIVRVVITTQESAIRIIDKTGPLHNPADRDHCIQYMTAIGLLKGTLTAEDYEDEAAADPRIDALRAKMTCVEELRYTREYLDPEIRSIANAVQVFFANGSHTERVEVEFPIGHRRRRAEGSASLEDKFVRHLSHRLSGTRVDEILTVCRDPRRLEAMAVPEFVELFTVGTD
ncbi:MAG: 2-methylcitrate dehydratase, partial [Pirellulaceae bacterium]